MSINSDRAYFLEMAKTRSFTRKQVEETFGVGAGTARNWTAHKGVEAIDHTYPIEYRAVGSNVKPQGVEDIAPKVESHANCLKLPLADAETLDKTLAYVLEGEPNAYNVPDKIKAISSVAELDVMIGEMSSQIVLLKHYRNKLTQ